MTQIHTHANTHIYKEKSASKEWLTLCGGGQICQVN